MIVYSLIYEVARSQVRIHLKQSVQLPILIHSVATNHIGLLFFFFWSVSLLNQ